jgi:hypothetical protein
VSADESGDPLWRAGEGEAEDGEESAAEDPDDVDSAGDLAGECAPGALDEAAGTDRLLSAVGADPEGDCCRESASDLVLLSFSAEKSKEPYERLDAAFWLKFSPAALFCCAASLAT